MELLGMGFMLVSGLLIGHYHRDIQDKIELLRKDVSKKKDARVQETKSTIIDPYDLEQRTKYERDEMMKQLNPGWDND